MGELWRCSGSELLGELVLVEQRIRQEYAASLELVAELESRKVVAEVGYPSLAVLLRDVLRVSPREARRRLAHAAAVTEVPLVSGGVTPAPLPVTAAALRDGTLGAEHVEVIVSTFRDLPLHVSDADRVTAERTLVDAARQLDPGTLTKVKARVRDWLDQDGTPPSDRELTSPLNELHLTTRRDGRTALHGILDREASAQLTALLSPLAKPRPATDAGPDHRSPAERHGDALVELLHLAADTGHLPSEAGERPHLLVTVPLDTLRHRPMPPPAVPQGASRLDSTELNDMARQPDGTRQPDSEARADGVGQLDDVARPPDRTGALNNAAWLDGVGRLDAESARRLACDAKVIPAVLGSRSEPLDLGRATYTIGTAIRRALVLRDRGCAFPGCDRPHRQCHGHHIHHWADGGETALHNLVLLCGQHHRLIHHSPWRCTVTHGRAEFHPPEFIDATRRPRHNTLHAA